MLLIEIKYAMNKKKKKETAVYLNEQDSNLCCSLQNLVVENYLTCKPHLR